MTCSKSIVCEYTKQQSETGMVFISYPKISQGWKAKKFTFVGFYM